MIVAFDHHVKRIVSPAPMSTHRKHQQAVSPSPRVQCARKHIKIEQEVSDEDDEIEVTAMQKAIKLEPHMPPAFHRLLHTVSLPFTSLVSTLCLPLPSPSPAASSSHLCLSSPSFNSCLTSSSLFPPPSLLYSMQSSTASSSSLASPSSLLVFPISFLDKD
jgi:hypothetical protein